jgi:hypothetical protein
MGRRFPQAALALVLIAGSWPFPPTSDRASEILAQARQAIGGETRLKAVKALSLEGAAQTDRERPAGLFTSLQVDFLLPDRFLISRYWPLFFLRRVGGFNKEEIIEQSMAGGHWADVTFGDSSTDARAWQLAARSRECARYLVAWLLMAPEQYAVQFIDAGGAEAAGSSADIVDAKGANGFVARLFFHKDTHRLMALTYREPPQHARAVRTMPPARPAERDALIFKSIEGPGSKADESTMHFADHRADDGVVFPHRIRIESEGLVEEWQISRFKVNPPLSPKQFEPK